MTRLQQAVRGPLVYMYSCEYIPRIRKHHTDLTPLNASPPNFPITTLPEMQATPLCQTFSRLKSCSTYAKSSQLPAFSPLCTVGNRTPPRSATSLRTRTVV